VAKAFWRDRRARRNVAPDPEAAFSLGARLAADGDIEGAREAYRRVVNSGHPEYAPVAARNLGHLNQQVGRLRQAHEAFQIAIESGHPDVAPRAMVDLGNLIGDSLYPENARPHYQAAVDSGHPEAAREAARHLADRKKSLVPNGPRFHPFRVSSSRSRQRPASDMICSSSSAHRPASFSGLP
jgi:tetratricopeptide (TPR) repeat protein